MITTQPKDRFFAAYLHISYLSE